MENFDRTKGNKTSQHGDSADASASLPWEGRPSIYEHIKQHIRPGMSGLAEGGTTLPDEEVVPRQSKFRWANGAMDGMLSHHYAGGDSEEQAEMLFKLVKAYCDAPTDANRTEIYNYTLENRVQGYVDSFLQMLVSAEGLDEQRLLNLAARLAVESADREPVKAGVAILGLFHGEGIRDTLLVLGRHNEFTLFSAVALGNFPEGAEQQLWELAKQVDGWGRIHTVERLASTTDPMIQDWMLHEACIDGFTGAYLACTCADTGRLRDAIKSDEVPDRTWVAARELISSLIRGGPAEDMTCYKHGAEVVALYIGHIRSRALKGDDCDAVLLIKGFLTDKQIDWESLEPNGWDEALRTRINEACTDILKDEGLLEKVWRDLESDDDEQFGWASWAASCIGIETWDYHLKRINQRPHDPIRWHTLVQHTDKSRIDELIELTERLLPLNEVATGPADGECNGPEYKIHDCLESVLLALEDYPGKGMPFILAGLSSPSVRNRNFAANVLWIWGSDQWPEGIKQALEAAIEREPVDTVRERMQRVLCGESPWGC